MSSHGLSFEPVRFSAALSLFGTAVISLLAIVFAWPAVAVVAVGAVWAAGIGIFNSLFIRNQVTANTNIPGVVHDTIIELSPYAPEIVNAIVPVATSQLLDGPKITEGTTGAVISERPES